MPCYHDLNYSHGFSAGNYSAAYDGLSLEAGLEKARFEGKIASIDADVDGEAYRVAFVLGYLSSLEVSEMGDDAETYLEAINSEHGRRCVELGYVEPLECPNWDAGVTSCDCSYCVAKRAD